MSFDAEKELAEIKTRRKMMRRKRFNQSALDKHNAEIFKLHKIGASLSDIRLFLKSKRVSVVNSTIHRWIKKHE